MKKTLMVLSFALCATVVFAQTNKVTVVPTNTKTAAVTRIAANDVEKADFNGSIFTKEDAQYFHCDFSAQNSGYTTSTVTGSQTVNGEIIPAHTQTAFHSRWNRITTFPDTLNVANYPVSGADGDYYYIFRYFYPDYFSDSAANAETPANGLMLMTMQDQIAVWGGTGTSGNFDAYIAFDPVNASQANMIRTRFFQSYRCFNSDKCWIDYSTDNQTWNAVEINVRDIDVSVNSRRNGWVSTMLPKSLGHQANVYLRIRWSCNSNTGGAYGYYWALDDFYVLDVPAVSASFEANEYFEGFYGMMPQNLQVPVVWNNVFFNNGQADHLNVNASIFTYAPGQAASALVTKHRDTIYSADKIHLIVDPLGWYDSAAVGRPSNSWSSANGVGYSEFGVGTGDYRCLPTSEIGPRHYYADITTNLRPNHIGSDGLTTFDTVRYETNWGAFNDTVDCGVWGRDNGIVAEHAYFLQGVIDDVWSQNQDEVGWNQEGYGVFVSYVTGDTVPEGWKILGMEMVAATENDMNEIGARVDPYVLLDARDSAGTPSFYYLNIGANTYVTDENDYIDLDALHNRSFTNDNQSMKTIRISFPNQPTLEANSSYRVGYRLNEGCNFAVATNENYFFVNDTAHYYVNTEGMEAFGHNPYIYNTYSILVYDAGYRFCPFQTSYPMIRLLVGPGYHIDQVPVNYSCDDENTGYFQNGRDEVLCGTTDSVAKGSSHSVYVMPVEGYEIDSIWIDNLLVSLGNHDTYQYDTTVATDVTYGYLTLQNIQTVKNLRCKFKEQPIGFDPVANKVSMKLQPNPATSNVNITLKGVSGMVNMQLIDMSGRVVSTRQFNAENGTNVNVSNLAKGAYFVRITNNNFTKIEKLIVR